MDIDAVKILSDRLGTNAALTAFFQSRYQKPVNRFIGYKRVPNASDFPCLSLVPVRQRLQDRVHDLTLSVVLGLHEPDITGGIFDGIEQSAMAITLITDALTPLRLVPGLSINPNWTINSDLGSRHPFYETELQLTLTIRQRLQYATQP